ncbi:MAG: hypothetical protein ABGX26_07200 [Nautiliaceae bacterium]|jgi:hypothetical protein
MKKLFFVIFLSHFLFATQDYLQKMTLLQLFKKQYYSYICQQRWRYINKYNNKREDLLSLVAYACLKKRYLTPALDLAKVLKVTKEGRKNATYITILFLMKKLIIQKIEDNLDLSGIVLPIISDNNLGKVYNYIQKGNYHTDDKVIFIDDGNISFKVWISNNFNVVVEKFENNQLKSREFYW